MKSLIFLVGTFLATPAIATDSPMVTYLDSPKDFRGAHAFKDKESGITFYVECDGRHVAAIDPNGKILWHRDPFVDAKLEPYRFEKPLIVFIWPASGQDVEGKKGRFVAIAFNSMQFGIMSFEKGDFTWLGQD
jgi:hypothetical protein